MTREEKLTYMLKIVKRLQENDTDFLRRLFNKLLRQLSLLQIKGIPVIIKEENLYTIANKLADFFGLDESFYKTKTRKREIVVARQILHSIYRDNSRLSLATIGGITYHDHTTVLHSKRTVSNLMDTDKAYRNDYFEIINDLGLIYKKYIGKTTR